MSHSMHLGKTVVVLHSAVVLERTTPSELLFCTEIICFCFLSGKHDSQEPHISDYKGSKKVPSSYFVLRSSAYSTSNQELVENNP